MTDPASRWAIPGAYALLLLDLVQRWQITDDEMLEGLDVTRAQLTAPATRLSPRKFRTLVQRGLELTGEPGLAIYMGLQMRLSSHGFLGFAAMTAPTVGAALALAERFASTRLASIGLTSHVSGSTVALVLEDRAPADGIREFGVISVFVGLAQVIEVISGRRIDGSAELVFDEPAYFARLAHLVPYTVRFARPANRLLFERSILDRPLVLADPIAAQLAHEQCERELASLGDADRTRARVRELLPAEPGGFRELEEVARLMHVSTRTLKRRLAAAGTTYSDVLDELRRERALLLVDDRRLSVDEIADRLGYSDTANFTRAFRRWTGTTPTALRKK